MARERVGELHSVAVGEGRQLSARLGRLVVGHTKKMRQVTTDYDCLKVSIGSYEMYERSRKRPLLLRPPLAPGPPDEPS